MTLGGLLPYLPLLSLDQVYVTDDGFASDIFNGELPGRVLVGQLLASGQAPVWSSRLCSGMPLTGGEPIGLGIFTYFDPAKALCLYVLFLVLVAAHGAYSFARRLGADRVGACLAGLAYAGSGYMVTQLKHLGIISTVVWLPWALLFLDRALARQNPDVGRPDSAAEAPPSVIARLRDLGCFGLVFAEQVLSGFPQSAYYCGLVYGAWALALLVRLRGRAGGVPLQALLGGACLVAATLAGGSGAVALLPLAELGSVSDRGQAQTWEFASMLPYSWSDAVNFLVPYANGDAANGTYRGPGFFWENYGYVGAATFLLALYGAVRGVRSPRVGMLVVLGLAAFALVLGPNTPVYRLAWKYLPGMGHFRFPTRLLFVVDFVICILGAVGLSLLRPTLERLLGRVAPRVVGLIPPFIVLATALDLFAQQSHQNPFVPASEWLAKPASLVAMGELEGARVFSPMHNTLHRLANKSARGWSDLNPYRELRETIAPNTGVFWGVSTADCYAGIAPAWFVDVWGDHSRRGLVVPALMRLGSDAIEGSKRLAAVLGGYGVTHLVSPIPIRAPNIQPIPNSGPAHVYGISGKRARVVPAARVVRSNREAADILTRTDFDLDDLVLLHVESAAVESNDARSRGVARVVAEDSRYLRVEVDAPEGGYLVLADTYYPGWRASVDGVSTRVLRANLSVRAVRIPAGARKVEFANAAEPFFLGLEISVGCLALLLVWVGICFRLERVRRQRLLEGSS